MFSFKNIWKYLRPQVQKHNVSFFLVLIGYAIGVVFDNIAKPYLFKEIVDAIASGGDHSVILHRITVIGFMLIGAILVQNFGYRCGDYASVFFQSKIMKELYDNALTRLLDHSYTFFTSNFSGSIIAKAKRWSKSFETLHDIFSYNIWFALVQIVGIMIVLFVQVPLIGWVFLIWILCVYFPIIFYFVSRKIKLDLLEAEADSKVTATLSDIISNILNVKIFSQKKQEEENFEKVTDEEEQKRYRAWRYGNFENLIQAITALVLHGACIFLFIYLWDKGQITSGTILMVEIYIQSLLVILWTLGRSLTRGMKALADMQEIVNIFETVPDILDPSHPQISNIRKGDIVFKDVTFEYQKEHEVFKDFNLNIASGTRAGLVGHSGSGKTTITKMILRFADVSGGAISIDGQDVRSITQDDLRRAISYVPQEPVLFHRSIRENITYGKPDATDAEIIEVAKKAHAHEFISSLSHGYDTLVGERGVKLSGGERQRVAIARAMLKDAPILILDEATSSLDSVSESYIQEALEELMKGKTVIIIAHRLSTIQKMDRIIVLDKGAIVEDGTHKDLLARSGVYADLWAHQSGGFIE